MQARPLVVQRFASAKAAPTEVSSILEERIRGVSDEANLNETGRVLSVGYVYSTEIFRVGCLINDVYCTAHLVAVEELPRVV